LEWGGGAGSGRDYWERWRRAAATDFAHTNFDPKLTGTSGMLKGPSKR